MIFIAFSCLPDPQAYLHSTLLNDQGVGLDQADITIYDMEETIFSQTQSDTVGQFSVALPPLQTFFVVIQHKDFMTQSYTGVAGSGDTEMDSGFFNMESYSTFLERAQLYHNCELLGGYIEGEVRVAIPQQEVEDLPIVTTAKAVAFNTDLISTPACYMHEDPTIAQTGEAGRYLVPNLREGLHEILLTVQYDAQYQEEFYYITFVPEEGRVNLLPTLIPL